MTKNIDKLKDQSTFAVKLANTVFVLGVLCSVCILVYSINKIYNPSYNISLRVYYISILFAGFFIILFSLGLNLKNEIKINLSVLLVTIVISIYTFEIYLEFSQENQHEKTLSIAKKMGVSFDIRTPLEVLKDLNDSGIEAYPNILPFEHIISNKLKIL